MADALHVYDRRERTLVRLADVALSPLKWVPAPRPPAVPVRRVLLLRLERIGDLLMTLEAIRQARAVWPAATVDLVVGAWNESLATLIRDVSSVRVLSVPWLARNEPAERWAGLISRARGWQRDRYDVGLNFEPDIRSNFLLWLSGARLRAGYSSGGGGAFLTSVDVYDPGLHVAENAVRLVRRAAALTGSGLEPPLGANGPRLPVPAGRDTRTRLAADARPPFIGMHVSGGRESKQWHLDRFAEVGRRLVADHGGTLVLTGSLGDAPLVADVCVRLHGLPVIDATGTANLVDLASLLASLDVLVTSDTGPMHLAAAVGTPVVALFGPSDPVRYGPRAAHERVLVARDVPCRPCGQVRRPPERCRGHVPDCMNGITVESVVSAAAELLRQSGRSGLSTAASDR